MPTQSGSETPQQKRAIERVQLVGVVAIAVAVLLPLVLNAASVISDALFWVLEVVLPLCVLAILMVFVARVQRITWAGVFRYGFDQSRKDLAGRWVKVRSRRSR